MADLSPAWAVMVHSPISLDCTMPLSLTVATKVLLDVHVNCFAALFGTTTAFNYFGIQMNNIGGAWEIYNNVFVSNLFAACCIDGWNKEANQSYVDFHHNTVLFSWCRTKLMEDMGYGYCFRSNVDSDVHHNIFGCSNYAAMERTHANSNKEIEAKRKTSAYDNRFFMNRCDLLLPAPGGGTWTYVKASQFEDVEQLVKYENNAELSQSSSFMKAIDEAYLKGFAQIKKMESSSFDRNSAANQYRQAHGLNMQGTEIVRVSMYGNRYDSFNR